MVLDAEKIVRHLQSYVNMVGWNVQTQRLVLKFGRPFKGIKRPKGIRLGRKKLCFSNAMNLVDQDGPTYVEGYALNRSGWPFHHA